MKIKGGRFLCGVVLAVFAFSAQSFAEPILGINGYIINTTFTPGGGTFGLGTLSIEDTVVVTVKYASGQVSMPGCFFDLEIPLFQDLSSGGLANGTFELGTLSIKDSQQQLLFSANIQAMNLQEVFNGAGMVAGGGGFEVTGGSLAPDFGPDGSIHQLGFSINPSSLSDFTGRFTGSSDVTLTPVPEPATMLLVGPGVLALIGFARRRMIK